MGLFGNVFGEKSTQRFTSAEAFAGVLLGAVACDGHISGEEADGLWVITQRMRLYDNWTGEKFSSMMSKLVKLHKREGDDVLLQKCAASLPDELCETVFANACDLVLADGEVEDEEEEFINKLQRILNIPNDTAAKIADVIVIKNRG